jgi:glycosyltransferase involved in cell wall biosynthesis
MSSLGHEVFLYAPYNKPDDAELPPHDKFIEIVSEKTWDDHLKDYDTNNRFFKFDEKDPVWSELQRRIKKELPKHIASDKENMVLCWFGYFYDKPTRGLPNNAFVIEAGIGYSGIFAKYKVFESYAWMHWMYGATKRDLGRWYDTVIPNSYNIDDFQFNAKKEDYFLFIGRMIQNKGIKIAEEVARNLGKKLYLAGQAPGNLKGLGIKLDDQVQYLGVLNKKERKEWMSKAKAIFVPTYYVGPFEGVGVEAQICGTPILTSHWGVFNETVQHGVTGFRCRTFGDFLWAAKHVEDLDPYKIRKWAVDNFSLDRVKHMYQAYFDQLADLGKEGWYELTYNPILNLDHYNKYYV